MALEHHNILKKNSFCCCVAMVYCTEIYILKMRFWLDPSSPNYESLQKELSHVQDQINVFLLQEEDKMEKRIR